MKRKSERGSRGHFFWLFLILILAFVLRLYKINIPLADNHSWRQADTAAVARNFVKEGFDFLRPRIDNMTYLHSFQFLNPERLFLVEPPFYNSLVAFVYSFFGINVKYARLVSIFFSLGTIVFLFLITGSFLNFQIGLLAGFFMAVLPYSIFYSRVVLPEPMMLFLSLGMIWFFWRWLEKGGFGRFILALIWTMFSLTMKSFPVFLALPMFYLVWKRYGFSFVTSKKIFLKLLCFLILACLPLLVWRFWISHFPEGIPPYDWLFNQGGIRFRPAFFRWIFAERIGKLILGYWGLAFLVIGLGQRPEKKEGWFFHFWFLAVLAYFFVLAAGNVTHDYYQIPLIPILCVFLAKGFWVLVKGGKQIFSSLITYPLTLVLMLFMLGFSWFEVRGFYNIQGGVDLAGEAVDRLTPKDALILTGDSNDATLLYNCNRHGITGGYASMFPNEPDSIRRAKELGITFYVTTKVGAVKNSDFGKFLLSRYRIFSETNNYLVVDLR